MEEDLPNRTDISTHPVTGYIQFSGSKKCTYSSSYHTTTWGSSTFICVGSLFSNIFSRIYPFISKLTIAFTLLQVNICSYWSRAKAKLKMMHGTCYDHLLEYQDEFMCIEGAIWKDSNDSKNTLYHAKKCLHLCFYCTLCIW